MYVIILKSNNTIISMKQDVYTESFAKLRINGELFETISATDGTRQTCPDLFNTVKNDINDVVAKNLI